MNANERWTRQIGPDFIKRLRLKIEGEQLEMRTTLNFPAVCMACLVSALASAPVCIYLDLHDVFPQYPSWLFAFWIAVSIFGTTIAGGLTYCLIALFLRRSIVLDRVRRQIRINGRVFDDLNAISHVEREQGVLYWCPLVLRLRNGRRIVLVRSQELQNSVEPAANKIADFLRVPYKDFSEGDYTAILQLKPEKDRLEMRPPNETLARWTSYIIGGVLIASAIVFAVVIFPRTTGHEMRGARGLGYLVFGIVAAVHFGMAHLFHRRIALDRRQGVLIGGRIVCPLSAIDHVGLHIGKNYEYHLSLVKTGGGEIPLVYYGGRPPTTSVAARMIAEFLSVPVRDYHAQAISLKATGRR